MIRGSSLYIDNIPNYTLNYKYWFNYSKYMKRLILIENSMRIILKIKKIPLKFNLNVFFRIDDSLYLEWIKIKMPELIYINCNIAKDTANLVWICLELLQ